VKYIAGIRGHNTLKEVRRLLLDAGIMCRCYGHLSQVFLYMADALNLPRAKLEAKLRAEVGGEAAMVEGKRAKEVYFGSHVPPAFTPKLVEEGA